MKTMKNYIFMLFAALCAVACFGDDNHSYSESFTLDSTFEYDVDFGSDSLFFDTSPASGFGWQCLAFFHKCNPDTTAVEGGFILSRLKGSGNDPENNRYRVNSKAGKNGLPTYAVFMYDEDAAMMPKHDVQFTYSANGTCTMIGCYVNNTMEVADSIRSRFQVGDRLVLKASGYLNGAKTGDAQILLADYSAQKDSIVVNWTPFDLSKLGSIEYVEFEMESTREGVPTCFCFDDMLAAVSLVF